MKTIIIRTQAELDALPSSFTEYTTIEIRADAGTSIMVSKARGSSHVEAWGSSHVVARGSSHVVAWESSHVEAWESSHVVAWGSSHVVAWGSSHVEAWESSHVEARGSSHVEAWGSSHVVARGSSHVEARESSHVVAWGSSHVVARGSSHVEAWGSSHVVARGSSHVEAWGSSHVVAWESSHVVARGSSHVVARESSHVVAWESSHVEARESSHVVAWGSSHVVAWGSSHVEAWGSSHVEAWESSHVVAWESSHVEARGNVSVHLHSPDATVLLFWIAVCIKLFSGSGKVTKKSGRANIVEAPAIKSEDNWLESNGVPQEDGTAVLFKRVSKDFKTQEGTKNETTWPVGEIVTHPNWKPMTEECNNGKFHGVAAPYLADEFRNNEGDRYVAIQIKVADMYAWRVNPQYPHKIAFRKGTVLYECDRYGKRIEPMA